MATTSTPTDHIAAADRGLSMANPLPIAFGIFGFSFLVYWVQYVGVTADTITGPVSEALTYALLIGGIAELLGGLLAIIKGIAHSGWTMSVLGIWLLGFFLLIQHTDPAALSDPRILQAGADGKPLPASAASALQQVNVAAWHAASLSWFMLMLAVPVLILAIRPVLDRNITLIIVFAGLIAVVILFGLAFHDVYTTLTDVAQGKAAKPDLSSAVDLLRVSAWASLVSAAGLFWVFGRVVAAPEGAHQA